MTDPVVATNTRRIRYVVTDSSGQDTFTITFPVVTLTLDSGTVYGIEVYVDDALKDTTDYTVDTAALTVTLNTKAAKDSVVVLDGATPAIRLLNYPLRGGLPSARLNQEANSFFYMIQELLRDRSRSIILSPSTADGVSGVLPAPAAGKAVIWNSSADGLDNGPTADEITSAQTYATNASTSATNAASSATDSATSATDAAASASAAAASASGMKWRPPVRATTTGTLPANTYSNGTSGVGATLTGNSNGALSAQDGVTLAAGDDLLVQNESTSSHNGIYTVTQVGDASHPYILTRRTDADAWDELVALTLSVEEGTTYADYTFICTVNSGGTIGTTSLTFGTFKVVVANNSIATAMIQDNAVTLAKLATQAANTTLANASASSAVPSAVALAASQLLGRGSTGNIAAIALTGSLSMSGANLTSSAFYQTKVGSFTRDVSTASGSQAITGVGFTPKLLFIYGAITNTAAATLGFANASAGGNIRANAGGTLGDFATDTTEMINITVSSGNANTAVLASFDSDGFTLTWTKVGTPTGTANLVYLAIG